jgi:hypothetical protein
VVKNVSEHKDLVKDIRKLEQFRRKIAKRLPPSFYGFADVVPENLGIHSNRSLRRTAKSLNLEIQQRQLIDLIAMTNTDCGNLGA